jgi:putative colanic acid biosysnthesis UDP-glucose lipid carrier transferase
MQRSVQHLEITPEALDDVEALSTAHGIRSAGLHSAYSLSSRNRRAGSDDLPIVALVKTTLNPVVVVLTLLGSLSFHGETLSGYYLVLAVLAFFISSQVFDDVDLYRSWRQPLLWKDGGEILFGWLMVVVILVFFGRATKFGEEFSESVLIGWFAATPVALLVAHGLARLLLHRVSVSSTLTRSMVIVGANSLGRELAAKVHADPNLCIETKGFFDDRSPARVGSLGPDRLLGRLQDVSNYVRQHRINRIYISLPMVAQPRIKKLLDDLRDTTASVYFVPDIFVFDLIQARFDQVNGIPVVAVCESPFYGLNSMLKRLSDIALSSLVMLVIWPFMLLIALGVRLSSPGPVLFKQRRYGLNGEEIIVYKFRTMTVCEDGDRTYKQVTKNDSRVTPFGALLRATSLDELPQIFNVLTGEMSLVGPRPHAVAVNEQYRKLISGYMIRHKVKPGITGWAQINGFRGGESLDEMQGRVAHDLDYLRNWSLGLDLWIILKTAVLVFRDPKAF